MKKLMIACAAVGLLTGVHAASWTWNTGSSAYYVDSAGELMTSGQFVLMYLGNGTAADWTMASAGNVRSTANLVYTPGPIPAVPDINKVSQTYDLTVGTDVNGMWYGVMVKDGDNYVQLKDVTSGNLLEAKQLSGFTDPSSTISDFTFATANYTEAVPEPFSGSLALLGVGLVALRRKMKKQKKA